MAMVIRLTTLLTPVPSARSISPLFLSAQHPAPSALTCLSPPFELGIKPETWGRKGGGGGSERRGKKRGGMEISFSYFLSFSSLLGRLLERGLDPFQPRTRVERTVVLQSFCIRQVPCPQGHTIQASQPGELHSEVQDLSSSPSLGTHWSVHPHPPPSGGHVSRPHLPYHLLPPHPAP